MDLEKLKKKIEERYLLELTSLLQEFKSDGSIFISFTGCKQALAKSFIDVQLSIQVKTDTLDTIFNELDMVLVKK